MGDIGAMKELLGRVETAAPRRFQLTPLNAEIAIALGGEAGNIGRIGWKMRNVPGIDYSFPRWVVLPQWMSDANDALNLIDQVLPNWDLTIERQGVSASASLYSPDWPKGPNADGGGLSVPAALCAALLRALILIEERKALAEGEVG